MLLVRSKELKNLNKKNPSIPVLAGTSSVCISFFSPSLWAQEETQSITSASSILSVFLSLVVVIAIIFTLAYIMRRFNVAQAGQGQMTVVASMMAGNKEKIMVIQVGEEQHLLGITAHNINHLAKLEQPLSAPKSGVATVDSSKLNFQQKLVQAMASGITGSKNKDGNNAK